MIVISQKKKKKTLIYLISGIIIIAIVGIIIYFAWPKSKSVKSQEQNKEEQTNSNKEIQKLKNELKSAKNKLDKLSNDTKKSQLENKLSDIEKQIKNFSNPDKTAIKKIEKEIKELKSKIESGDKNDKPNDNPPENPEPGDKNDPPEPDPQPDNKPWKYVATKINDNTYKYKITLKGLEMDFFSSINRLEVKNKTFFKIFQEALKDANTKFPAYFWECPPVTEETLNKTFEFVVIKSESLNNTIENWTSFGKHVSNNYQKWSCSFPGKSGDNILVIPIPKPGPDLDFKNISQFTKNAPEEQQQEFWKEVAEKLMEELKKGDTPRWLSTHGLGVPYLHVRIDEKPKLYSYSEYKKWE